jgi:hypothetical protein
MYALVKEKKKRRVYKKFKYFLRGVVKKISLRLDEITFDKFICLLMANDKSFENFILLSFENHKEAQRLYDEMIQLEFEKILKEKNEHFDNSHS